MIFNQCPEPGLYPPPLPCDTQQWWGVSGGSNQGRGFPQVATKGAATASLSQQNGRWWAAASECWNSEPAVQWMNSMPSVTLLGGAKAGEAHHGGHLVVLLEGEVLLRFAFPLLLLLLLISLCLLLLRQKGGADLKTKKIRFHTRRALEVLTSS